MLLLKRLFYKVLNPFRKLYWYIFKPKTIGVKCLIESEGKFLCILNSYYPMWTFPGGGVNRKETSLEAAKRETLEEVGLDIQEWTLLGEYHSEREFKRDVVYCFHSNIKITNFRIDNDEVIEAGWFSEAEIPEPRSFAVEKVFELYHK